MAATLVTTIGGASANSYVTLDEAETYLDTVLEADAWEAATAPRRTRALLQAARRLQDENWIGERATSTQALAWPRFDASKPDSSIGAYSYGYKMFGGRRGEVYSVTEIPERVKQAQIELALAYLDGWGADDGADEADVSEASVDGLRLVFKSDNPRAGQLPARAAKLISDLVRGPEFVR